MEQWMYWVVSITIAFLAFYFGRKDKEKEKVNKEEQEAKQEATQDTTLSLNVQYIKEGVDRMGLEQKDTNRKLEKQGEEFVKMQIKQAEMQQQIKVLNNAVFKKEGIHD